jgi:hypothetical protein
MPSITAAQSLTSIACPNCGRSGSLKSQLPRGSKLMLRPVPLWSLIVAGVVSLLAGIGGVSRCGCRPQRMQLRNWLLQRRT